eukprot:6052936-Pleurochrysis_carterae.AAC.1
MFKELKDELANLHNAYDSDEHERQIENMRDELGRTLQTSRTRGRRACITARIDRQEDLGQREQGDRGD